MARRLRIGHSPRPAMPADAGGYALAGVGAALRKGFSMQALQGALFVSGQFNDMVHFVPGVPDESPNYRYVKVAATGTGSGLDWTNAMALPAAPVRGLTYWLASGSYGSRTFSTANSGTTRVTLKKATVASHGTATGWDNSFATGTASFGPIHFTTSFWTLDGQTGGGPGAWTSGFGVQITSTTVTPVIRLSAPAGNITCMHFKGTGNLNAAGGGTIAQDGIAAYGSGGCSGVLLSHFAFENIGRCHFFVNTHNSVYEFGHLGEHVSTEPQHSECVALWNIVGGARPNTNTWRYCIFRHVEGTGGIIADADNVFVYGNVFYRDPAVVWQHPNGVFGTWTVSTITGYKVYNNTLINVQGGEGGQSMFGNLFTAPTTGNEVRNNLMVNCTNIDLGGAFPVFSHNSYFSCSGFPATETGRIVATGSPLVDPAALDFRLASPSATSGFSLASPFNLDPLGVTRGADGVWDRGAYEKV